MGKRSRAPQAQSKSGESRRWLQPHRPDRTTLLIILLVLTVLLIIWWRIGSWYHKRLLADKRTQITAQSIPYGNALTSAIYRRFALLQGLKTFAEISASYTDMDAYFDAFASGLHSSTNGIRNLSIAPGGVQQHVYPLAGNENVPGHDLIHDKRSNVRADVQRAILTGRIAISGPYELRQGGLGLVARQAIFQNGKFWGLVAMVLDMPPVLDEAGLELQSANLELALRDSSGQVFYGQHDVFQTDPAIFRVELPEGVWELASVPRGGWTAPIREPLLIFYVAGLIIIGLLVGSLYLVAARQTYLRFAVRQATQNLDEELSKHTLTEKLLRESETRFKMLADATFEGIAVTEGGIFVDLNQQLADLLGYERRELIGRSVMEIVASESREVVTEAIRTNRLDVYEHVALRKDGSTFPVETRARTLSLSDRTLRLASIRDMTERKQAQQEIEQIARFPKENPNPVLRVKKDGTLTYANESSLPLLQTWGTSKRRLLPAEWHTVIQEVFRSGISKNVECQSQGRILLLTFAPIVDEDYVNVYGLDITKRKQAEAELQEYSERLEAMVEERTQKLQDAQEHLVRQERIAVLGQLAGGVAHELRNPLGAIKNSVYFLNMVLENPESDVAESLQILDREVSNSQHIITSLLDFARPQKPNLRQVDLTQLLQEVLAHQTMLAHIEVETMFAEGLPQIMADPSQLEIVFDNLIHNAVQAMPEGGRLSVNTSEVREESSEDRWIAVSIADTGIGIPNENIEKLFEPLFTTRAKGIGLGLALVRNLVEANGGSVAVKGEVDKGSTFTIRLPIGRNKLDETLKA